MLFDSERMNHNFSLVRLGFGQPENQTPEGALGFLLLQGYEKIHRSLLGTIAVGLFSGVEFGAFTF